MKKFILMSLLAFSVLTGFSQENRFKPYASVGGSFWKGGTSVGLEAGVYNPHVWFSGALSVDNSNTSYTSVKAYSKLGNVGIIDGYVWSGLNMALTSRHPISFEPGVATVFNFWKKFAPQLSFSLPISNGVATLTYGVGLNYWIK